MGVSELCSVFVHVKGLQSKKGLVDTKGGYSPPQKTLLLYCLKHLVWSEAFIMKPLSCLTVLQVYTLQSVSRHKIAIAVAA